MTKTYRLFKNDEGQEVVEVAETITRTEVKKRYHLKAEALARKQEADATYKKFK